MTRSAFRDLALLAAVCLLCFFWQLGASGLFDLNEALYTQAAREMFLRDDLVTPSHNGLLWFDKPPLALWCVVFSFRVFGQTELAARLPVALAASLLAFATYFFGRRYLGRRTGLLAALMLCLNPMFLATARQMTMDVHQTLWFAVAVYCFFAAYVLGTRRGSLWYYGFWAGVGLSFMAKSAPALMAPIVCGAFVLADMRWQIGDALRRILRSRIPTGLLLLAAIVGPWFALVWRAHGSDFFREFFIHHHVALLTGKDFSHAQPIWYYVPGLLVGMLPWSFLLPLALGKNRDEGTPRDAARTLRTLLLAWFWVVFVLFSLMRSKLPQYLLIMYPAAALLVADRLSGAWEERTDRGLAAGLTGAALLVIVSLVGAIVALTAYADSPGIRRLHYDVAQPVIEAALWALMPVVLGFSVAAAMAWTGRSVAAIATALGAMLGATVVLIGAAIPALQATLNAPLHDLARTAGPDALRGVPIVMHLARPIRPSVLFYLPDALFEKPVLPASAPFGDVMESGDAPVIAAYVRTHRPCIILTDQRHEGELETLMPEIKVIRRADRWVLLRSDRAAH